MSTQLGLVVGVDGSTQSRAAIIWATREALMRNLPLTLIHVVPAPAAWEWSELPTSPELSEIIEENSRAVMAIACAIVDQTATGHHTPPVHSEIVSGSALHILIDRSKDADMVVVGCRGLGKLARRLLGSVSSGLVRHSHCPVAVIHEEEPVGPSHGNAPVVVGIDGSPASESATALAFDEASRRGVGIVAVHAWSDFTPIELPGLQWEALQEQAEESLSERLAGWQERYPEVAIRRVVVLDRPAHQLLEQSKSAQLTVVGCHGRGDITGLLLGSVSSAVAELASTPVLVARSSDKHS